MALDTRHVHVVTPLDPDQLMLHRVRAVEELGRLFQYDLELLSPDPHLKLGDLLGDKMTVVLSLPDGERYFNGIVSRIGQAGSHGRFTCYRCTLRPSLWFLTRASDSRIYPKLTVPDIVKKVVQQFGVGQVVEKLQHTYPVREYTVQYRETYFDFLSRLMEEEGIYYTFQHEKSQHKLVLCDDKSSHAVVSSYEKVPYIDPEQNAAAREEHLNEWTLIHEVQTAGYAVNDFDFVTPRADLTAKKSQALKHKHADLEQYDPVAGFVDAVDAGEGSGDPNKGARSDLLARVRLEELQAEYDRAHAAGNARGLACGALFELADHPRDDQNREYLVVRAEYHMFQPGYDSGSGRTKGGDDEEPLYDLTLVTQPSKLPFRPVRTTRRPFLPGPHPAIVIGSGEIWTDKFGRVKVHFPWDRENTEGCWVRVAQLWAGGGWGGVHVPRVGQEVIVEFIEGDPDRPIITGRVYNGTNLPPFGLPGGATKSGILTRSTPSGGPDNANEIRFEDKKGEEQVFLHAEKNMDTEVEKDQTLWVGNDRTKKVDGNQVEEVKKNKKIHVLGTHIEDIDGKMSLHVKKSEDETIDGSRSVTVGGNHNETIAGVQGVTVGGAAAWSAGGAGSINWGGVGAIAVGGNLTFGVGGNMSQSVVGNTSLDCSKNVATTAGKSLSTDVTEDMSTSVGKKYVLNVGEESKTEVKKAYGLKAKEIMVEAEDGITLKSGDATIVIKKGDVTIQGKNINVKMDSDIVMKGSKVAQN